MLRIALPAALMLAPAVAPAQAVVDVGSLVALEDVEVVSADGNEVGEVEDALVGPDGSIVALVVEAGGFLGIGESERVVPLDRLTFQNGDFVTDLAADEVEALPEWDD